MFSYWRRGDSRAPVEGEVDGGEASSEVPGGVLCSEGGEGGEGLWESSRGWIRARGGAGNPEGGQASPVPAVGGDGGEAGLAGKNGGGRGVEAIRPKSHALRVHLYRGSSLNPNPA